MSGLLRAIAERPVLEVGLEDGLQDELQRTLDHAVADRRDRQDADLAPVLWDRLLPVPQGPICAPDQFVPDLLEEEVHSARLDGLERDPVDTRGPVVLLGHRVGFVERLPLTDVDVQAPETPGRFGLRLDVDPPPQVLQIDGRLYHLAPASRVGEGVAEQQGPFAPRALPRLIATAGPSATLSPSADFPGSPVIRPTCLRRFRGGARRASPVARCALVTVPSLPPRRSVPPRQPRCGGPCCLRPTVGGSASGASHFRGHHCVHSRYGPVTRRPSRGRPCRWASGQSVSLLPAIRATGVSTLPPAGLTPAEHISLTWTHNRTGGSPASGSPVGGLTSSRIDGPEHGRHS